MFRNFVRSASRVARSSVTRRALPIAMFSTGAALFSGASYVKTIECAPATLPPHGVAGTKNERTFIAIKPDGVQRGLVGEIIGRFERKGFKLVGLKQLTPSRELAESHYGVHRERPFFAGLVDFITSGPVVAMVWEGDGVIASARKLIGATKPLEAEPGTIRGDLAVNIGRNVIHGSDAPETAEFEIGLWFQPSELSDWSPADQVWRVEG